MTKFEIKHLIFFSGTNASRNDPISMNDKYRHILRRTWPTLRNDLEPIKLLPYLVDVLDPADEGEIKASSKKKREDAVDKLLEILPRKGQKAFDVFKNALQKVQPHLAFHLGERLIYFLSYAGCFR